jgi:hypothetical protein
MGQLYFLCRAGIVSPESKLVSQGIALVGVLGLQQIAQNCFSFFFLKEFPCPLCNNPVKKVTLSTRTLDDVQCEKDTSWRRRVMKVFNKVETDFPALLEYNNYLEEVEDTSTFNFCYWWCFR